MKFTDDEKVIKDPRLREGAINIKELTSRLTGDYMALMAALYVASHPASGSLGPSKKNSEEFAGLIVQRKGNGEWGFDFAYHLNAVRSDKAVNNFKKAYLANAITVLADNLSRFRYFNHDPALELIYHLRNGVAHGNKFNFTDYGKKRLRQYPAHNRGSWSDWLYSGEFEVTPDLQESEVLFEFMEPGDILDAISNVGISLQKQATGLPILTQELRKLREQAIKKRVPKI